MDPVGIEIGLAFIVHGDETRRALPSMDFCSSLQERWE